MVESARLESVFTRKGNEGSNPSLSAIYHPPSIIGHQSSAINHRPSNDPIHLGACRGELKKLVFDPLFSLDLACATLGSGLQ